MKQKKNNVTASQLQRLAEMAWEYRERAYVLGGIKVGAAVIASDGSTFAGCNIEHYFRSHDIHAEVNAIASMVARGHRKLIAIIIVAEQENFTPCGACMDWILQFGGSLCLVGCQSRQQGEIKMFRAKELMPYYPGRKECSS